MMSLTLFDDHVFDGRGQTHQDVNVSLRLFTTVLKLPLSDAEPISSSLPFSSQAARIKYGAPAAKTADAAFLRSTLNPSPPSFLACFSFFFLSPFLFCLFQTCHLPLPSVSSDLFLSLYYLELCQVPYLPFSISISSLRPSLIRSDEAL